MPMAVPITKRIRKPRTTDRKAQAHHRDPDEQRRHQRGGSLTPSRRAGPSKRCLWGHDLANHHRTDCQSATLATRLPSHAPRAECTSTGRAVAHQSGHKSG